MDFLHHDGKDYFHSVEFAIQPVQENARWKGVIEEDSCGLMLLLRRLRKSWRDALNGTREDAEALQQLVLDKFSDEKLYELFYNSIIQADPVEQLIDLEEML